MAVNVSLGSKMLFYTHTGEVITFFEITVSSFVCFQCNWRSEICKSVTHYTVTTNCMEKVLIFPTDYRL